MILVITSDLAPARPAVPMMSGICQHVTGYAILMSRGKLQSTTSAKFDNSGNKPWSNVVNNEREAVLDRVSTVVASVRTSVCSTVATSNVIRGRK